MHDELGKWLAVGMLMLGGAAFTALLRWARGTHAQRTEVQTSWSILGGMLAGLILGASVFGRIFPSQYQEMYRGGAAQRIELDRLMSRQGADQLAATEAGIDAEHFAALRDQHQHEFDAANANWQAAQWRDQSLLRLLTLIIVALTLLSSAAFAIDRREPRHGVLTPLSIGIWAAALPGAGIYTVSLLIGFANGPSAAIVAAALAIGPWAIVGMDRAAADGAELNGARLMQNAGRVSSVIAIMAAAWGFHQLHGVDGLWRAGVLLALPASWLMAALLRKPRVANEQSQPSVTAILHRRILEYILLPTLAGLIMVKIDVRADFALVPMILILLASDDGRWLGAFIGTAILGGRSAGTSLRLALGSMAAGATQLCITGLATAMHDIPNELALALLLGCVLIEITAPLRGTLSNTIVAAQSEDQI